MKLSVPFLSHLICIAILCADVELMWNFKPQLWNSRSGILHTLGLRLVEHLPIARRVISEREMNDLAQKQTSRFIILGEIHDHTFDGFN